MGQQFFFFCKLKSLDESVVKTELVKEKRPETRWSIHVQVDACLNRL